MNDTTIDAQAASLRKHSRLGVASFLFGILTPLIIVCLFIFSQKQDFNLILGILIIFTPLLLSHLVGSILGIAGIYQAKRKKLFPILGTILNGLFLLSAGVLVVVILIMLVLAGLGGFH